MWTEVCHSENKSDDEHKSIYGNPEIHFLSSLFHNNPGIKVNVKKGTTPAQWQQCSCVCASKQACMRVYVCVVVKGETFTSRDQGHITSLCIQVNLCLSLTSCVNSLTHTCTHTHLHTHTSRVLGLLLPKLLPSKLFEERKSQRNRSCSRHCHYPTQVFSSSIFLTPIKTRRGSRMTITKREGCNYSIARQAGQR